MARENFALFLVLGFIFGGACATALALKFFCRGLRPRRKNIKLKYSLSTDSLTLPPELRTAQSKAQLEKKEEKLTESPHPHEVRQNSISFTSPLQKDTNTPETSPFLLPSTSTEIPSISKPDLPPPPPPTLSKLITPPYTLKTINHNKISSPPNIYHLNGLTHSTSHILPNQIHQETIPVPATPTPSSPNSQPHTTCQYYQPITFKAMCEPHLLEEEYLACRGRTDSMAQNNPNNNPYNDPNYFSRPNSIATTITQQGSNQYFNFSRHTSLGTSGYQGRSDSNFSRPTSLTNADNNSSYQLGRPTSWTISVRRGSLDPPNLVRGGSDNNGENNTGNGQGEEREVDLPLSLSESIPSSEMFLTTKEEILPSASCASSSSASSSSASSSSASSSSSDGIPDSPNSYEPPTTVINISPKLLPGVRSGLLPTRQLSSKRVLAIPSATTMTDTQSSPSITSPSPLSGVSKMSENVLIKDNERRASVGKGSGLQLGVAGAGGDLTEKGEINNITTSPIVMVNIPPLKIPNTPKSCCLKLNEWFWNLSIIKKLEPYPWSLVLAIFEFCADWINLLTSLIMWQDEWKLHPKFDERDHVYALLFMTILLYVGIEIGMSCKLYDTFIPNTSLCCNPMKGCRRRKQLCVNPKNIKMWLLVWYFPNMCVLAPNAALLKVFFHWAASAYTLYYAANATIIDNALIGKLSAQVIEIPVAIAQAIILIIQLVKMSQVNHLELETDEWLTLLRGIRPKWAPLPRLTNVFHAKKNAIEIAKQLKIQQHQQQLLIGTEQIINGKINIDKTIEKIEVILEEEK